MKKKTSYKLSSRTIDLGEALLTVPWFENIGKPLDAPHAAKQVNSLDEAIQLFSSSHWDDTILEANNGLSEAMYTANSSAWDSWNDIIYAANVAFEDRYKVIYNELVSKYGLPPKGWTQFILTIRHACQESEFVDYLPLGFFSEIISWYIDGYFPCGFDGEYPNGQLMVY